MTETTENKQIAEIRRRVAENAYFINPHSDVNAREDLTFLLSLIDHLEKKGNVLSQQVLELTQEIENIKSDFDSRR